MQGGVFRPRRHNVARHNVARHNVAMTKGGVFRPRRFVVAPCYIEQFALSRSDCQCLSASSMSCSIR